MAKFCSAPWDTIQIYRDGTVSVCLCRAWNNHNGVFGNLILSNSLGELLESKKLTDFRNSIIDQSFKFCNKNHCPQIWNLTEVDSVNEVTPPRLPSKILLGIDNVCNLSCYSCRPELFYEKRVSKAAEIILNKLVEEYKDYTEPVEVYCDSSGEVFISLVYLDFFDRDDLPKCFKFCLTTNGNLVLNNLRLIEKIKNQIDTVIISLDASNSDTYKVVRGGKFDKVIDGIKALRRLDINVSTQFVVQYLNYREILEYKKLCDELGVSHIGLQQIRPRHHMRPGWWEENRLEDNPAVDLLWLVNALKELSDSGVGLCGGLYDLISRHSSNS